MRESIVSYEWTSILSRWICSLLGPVVFKGIMKKSVIDYFLHKLCFVEISNKRPYIQTHVLWRVNLAVTQWFYDGFCELNLFLPVRIPWHIKHNLQNLILIFLKTFCLKKGGVIKSDITLVKNETTIIILTLYSTLGT